MGDDMEMEMRQRPLNRDVIKYMAMLTMTLNHIANVFLESGTLLFEILVDIGYFTAPVMIFFMTEGYDYTRSKKKYALRLLLFAVLSQVPFSLAFTGEGAIEFVAFNMLFTLLACFGIIHIMKTKQENKNAKWWIAGLVLFTCFGDWGGLAPLLTYFFVRAENDRVQQKQAWRKAALIFGAVNFADGFGRLPIFLNLTHFAGCTGAVALAGYCILYLYNGKRMVRGRNFSKWFFYLYYPLHLLILGGCRLFIQ